MKIHQTKFGGFILASGIFLICIGVWIATGWLLNSKAMVYLFSDHRSMKINTAVCIVLLGIVQLLHLYRPEKRWIKNILSGIIIALSLASLTEWLLDISLGIDELLVKDKLSGSANLHPGRMSPSTAFCFILIATGLFLLDRSTDTFIKTAQSLFHLVTIIAVIAFLGHLTKFENLYSISSSTSIAFSTSLCFLIFSVTATLFNYNQGITGIFSGNRLGNFFARKLVFRIFIILLCLTFIRLLAHEYLHLGVEFGITLFALSFFLTFILITAYTVGELNKIEAVKNIAERSLTQLSDNLEQYRAFITESPSAIAMLDTNMHYIAASKKWIEDYGLTGKKIIGISHYEIFPEIGEDWKQIHRECLAGAINKCEESSFEREDGTMQWISWDVRPWNKSTGEIGGIIMLTEDLTAKKEAEIINQQFNSILEKTSAITKTGTWEFNLRTNELFWSSITKEIHEVEQDYQPKLSTALSFYKEGESKENISKAVDVAITTGQNYDLELQIVSAKGNVKWVRAIGMVDFINQKPVKMYGIFQDLEKQKQYELELKELLSLTTEQNKSLKNYAHIVSHNLNSHTGNIRILLEMLVRKKPELRELESVKHLIDASAVLSETVMNLSEIVSMSNIKSDQFKAINLYETLEKVILSVSTLIESSAVEVANEIDKNMTIKGIPAYVESIFLNLLTNGIKYREPSRKSYIRFSSVISGKSLILHAADNGLGIDLGRHKNKIFGMYKTFHNHPDSRGLGLFMSKNQIESMGGRIEVESIPGAGTTFYLNFQL